MKTLKVRSLSTAVALGLSALAAQSAYALEPQYTQQQIGDLEIYKAATGGSVTLTMMLDISGSMVSIDEGSCVNPVRASSVKAQGTFVHKLIDKNGTELNEITRADGTKVNVSKGVKIIHAGARGSDGYWYYCEGPTTRMEKMKQAMINVIKDERLLGENVKLGVGIFPTQHNLLTGQVSLPAKPLTREHRWNLMRYIATLQPTGATPSAQAYVEAGAYMLGTTTAKLGAAEKRVITVGFNQISNNNFNIRYCAYAPESQPIINGSTGQLSTRPATPTTFDYNGSTLKWYTCNAGDGGHFPPFDYDQVTRSSSWLAPITPDTYVKNLDFDLLPEFDLMYGPGVSKTSQYPLTAMTNATVPKTTDGWRNSYKQLISSPYSYTFGKIIDYRIPGIANSGFPLSAANTKKTDGNTYESPIGKKEDVAECNGYGIYFLTDGEPNMGTTDVLASANLSLNKTGNYTVSTQAASDFPRGKESTDGYWGTIGSYAYDLRTKKNPLGASIRTATVGFGSVFTPTGGLPLTTKKINGEDVQVTDCDRLSAVDARNLCRWGEKGYGYGEGGFLATSDAKAVSESVVSFVNGLSNTIPTAPTGTISIPNDPYSTSSQLAYAYLPMIDPHPSESIAVWPGNMKKYTLKGGTVWGKNKERLYKDQSGALSDNAQDEWSTSATGNDAVTTGGLYAQLTTPKSGAANVRTVYIEDGISGASALRKFGVNAAGKLILDNKLLSANPFIDTATYTLENVKYLLHFLGFSNATTTVQENGKLKVFSIDEIPSDTRLADITLQKPDTDIRVLGASPHSSPTSISYRADLDPNTGNVSSAENARDDFVLFGSMDGALHMTDAKKGTETFAFIPKVMLANQAVALKGEKGVAGISKGVPKFGIDAPWAIFAKYDYNPKLGIPTEMRVTEDIYAYGGFRMGGNGLYGLNLGQTKLSAPELAFALTPSVAGFERLGQIWSKPTKTKIKRNGESIDVLIFGGGYDMCYENENFQVGLTGQTYAIDSDQNGMVCANKTEAIGNAVYMVDAKTGKLLWTAKGRDIKHSIVGEVSVIDRNNDGNTDAIYFADLGGQIFRADAESNDNGIPSRITRLLAPADKGTKYVRRFYNKPVVSVYQVADFNGGKRFALVNAISGDRSNPVSELRETAAQADRMYGIMDTDIGLLSSQFYGDDSNLTVKDLSDDDDVVNLAGITDDVTKKSKLAEVKTKKGWYYPLTYFDGYSNVKYTKGVGKSEVIGSLLFSSVYNPDKQYGESGACTASVKGGSEYQMYCLPFGICNNEASTNGRGGFLPAGQGISELTLGPLDSSASGSAKRVLISSVAVDNSTGSGSKGARQNFGAAGGSMSGQSGLTSTGGDGSMPRIVFDQRFVFQSLRWYDNSIKNN